MWLFPCCWYNFLLTSQGHREGVSFSLSWTSASASLSSAHPHRDAGAMPELGRRQHTHRPSEGRKSPDHQNYFWRDLLALSPLAPLKAENRAEHPEGKKEDERIFLPKGRRDHYQSHSEKIRKSYTKQRGRLFPSEGTNCKLAEHLDNNFLSPTHVNYTPPNKGYISTSHQCVRNPSWTFKFWGTRGKSGKRKGNSCDRGMALVSHLWWQSQAAPGRRR